MRLLWILRSPTERAYSHFIHNVNNGLERRSFEDAIDAELQGLPVGKFLQYLARGIYLNEIRWFGDRFPSDQLLIVTLDELTIQPMAVLSRIFGFLGVDPEEYEYRPLALNQRYRAAFPRLAGRCARTFGYYSFPHRIVRAARLPYGHPPLSQRLRTRLNSYYDQSIQELESHLGIDLTSWRQEPS
jgi:hypothetical protein